MKTLSLPLVASAMLLAAPSLCCAAPATTPSTQVRVVESEKSLEKAEKKEPFASTQSASEKAAVKKSPKAGSDDADDLDDDLEDEDDLDDEEDFDEEAVSAPYPFGELKLEQGTKMPVQAVPQATPQVASPEGKIEVKSGEAPKPSTQTVLWKAELPAKSFTIRSEWDEKPEFQNAARPDGKPQGAATLAMQQISEQEQQPFSLYVLMYIYDPETVGIAMNSPEKVIEQLITAPAEEAKQYGFVSTITDLPPTQPVDTRLMQEQGVLQDVRKKVGIGQQDKTLYSQFYRLFIGKDFVVLGLVLGGEDGLEKKAQNFFDHISLVPNKTPVAPVAAPAKTPAAEPVKAPAAEPVKAPAAAPAKALVPQG